MSDPVFHSIPIIYEFFSSIMIPWGLVALFFLGFAESLYIVGLFAPGEVVIVAAVMVAVAAKIPVWIVSVVYILGSITSVIFGYFLGKRLQIEGIRNFLTKVSKTRIGRLAKVDPSLVDDMNQYFETHGAMTSFVVRFAYGVKSFIPPMAGASKLRFWNFVIPTSLGIIAHTTLLTFVGWLIQSNLGLAATVFKSIGWVAAAILVLLLTFAFFVLRKYGKRRQTILREARDFPLEATAVSQLSSTSRLIPVSARFWKHVEYLDEVSSTNDYALSAYESGQKLPAAYFAQSQFAGRGRFNRVWASPKGGFYASLILKAPEQGPTTLSILSSYAVQQALSAVFLDKRNPDLVNRINFKWPNDIYLDDKKLAGILLEQHGNAIIIGIGVNNQRPENENALDPSYEGDSKDAQAAYLSDLNLDIKYRDLAASILSHFELAYANWEERGIAPYLSRFEKYERSIGKFARIVDAFSGETKHEGYVRGIAEDGALLLEESQKMISPSGQESTEPEISPEKRALKGMSAREQYTKIYSGEVSLRVDENAPLKDRDRT